ncbi:MAG: uroporphyrinogen-III synthase [Emcibacteraceae bacterium]|nr:uroporphyrinogen-III synthase [Emcibacteraceae bacterium]MDG1995183.1 uroporphyrinogen-III synthase [Emcibacteraceae bacterium]
MRFLLTRPILDSTTLGQKLLDQDQDVIIDPLMAVKSLPLKECAFEKYQALVFTSVNGVRSFHEQFGVINKPLFVVGNKTENIAKILGFTDIKSADGDAEKLAEFLKSTLLPNDGPILYLSAKHVSHNLAELLMDYALKVERYIIYDMVPAKTLNQNSISALESQAIDYIPFYSKRSALIFIEIIKNNDLQHCLSSITALCLSARVADALNPTDWNDIMTAENPRERDLFNLIAISL